MISELCPDLVSSWHPTFEELLLQFRLCNLNLNSLVNLLGVSLLMVGVVFDGRREEGVDEGGLSQPRFSSNLPSSAAHSLILACS